MAVHRLTTPGLSINTYIVIDSTTKKAAVIDPFRDTSSVIELIRKEGADVIAILETHVHADFISGAKQLQHDLNGNALIYCSGLGGVEWTPKYADVIVKDHQDVVLGNWRLQAWHTPGHTPEHLMWVLFDDKTPIKAFTGDFLFVGSIGRPDLLGQEECERLASKLYESVFKVLPLLPDGIEILPGHGAGSLCGKGIAAQPISTLGEQRKNNPALLAKPMQDWIRGILENMPSAPAYFAKVKKLNVSGLPLMQDLSPVKKITLNSIPRLTSKESFLLDIRSKEDFAASHFNGSINVPYSPMFLNWAPLVIPYDNSVTIIAKDDVHLASVMMSLKSVGIDRLAGICILDDHAIGELSDKLASFPLISPLDAFKQIQFKGEGVVIIDVRTPSEWNNGHISGALHIELKDLEENIPQLPKGKTIGTICGSGYRASIAASLLQKHGHYDVFNIQGGMQEWMKSQLPLM